MYARHRTKDLVPLFFRWQTARTTSPALSTLIPTCGVYGHPRSCFSKWTESRYQFQRIASYGNISQPGLEISRDETNEPTERVEQEERGPECLENDCEPLSDANHKEQVLEPMLDFEHLDSVFMTQPFSEQQRSSTPKPVPSIDSLHLRKITKKFPSAKEKINVMDYDQIETLRPMRSALIHAIQRRPTMQSGREEALVRLADDLAYLLEYRFGYTFQEKNLLMVALIHASKIQQSDNTIVSIVTNRNMALLGDMILALTGKTVFASKVSKAIPPSDVEKPKIMRVVFGRANEALRVASTDRLLSKLCMTYWKWPRILMVHDKKYSARPLQVQRLPDTDQGSLATFVEAVIAAVYLDSLSFSTAADFTRVAVLDPMLNECEMPIIQEILALPGSQVRPLHSLPTESSSTDLNSNDELASRSPKPSFWSLKRSRVRVTDLEKVAAGSDVATSGRKLRPRTGVSVKQGDSEQVEHNSGNDTHSERQGRRNEHKGLGRNGSVDENDWLS